MGKKRGPLREISKAQAGKRAQIEKLIESERKEPYLTTATIRPTSRSNTRPIVRLPGQPLAGTSAQQAGRARGRKNGRAQRQPIPRSISLPLIPIPPPADRPREISVNLPLPELISESFTGKALNFLLLPGELRNKIYGYVFPNEFFQLEWIKRTSEQHLTYTLPKRGKSTSILGPSAGRRRRLFDFPRRIHSKEVIPPYRLSPGPAALLLICKKVNEEATPIFYGSSTFAFSVPGTLRAFLTALSPQSKEAIRSIALKHHTAGNPVYTEFQPWKSKDDNSWDNLLWEAAEDLENLEQLNVDLTINDVPILFGPRACWKVPLLAFQGKGLKKCDVKLRNFTTPDTVLEVEQMILKKEILGKEFKEEDEVMDKEKVKVAERRRRVRVLNLVDL